MLHFIRAGISLILHASLLPMQTDSNKELENAPDIQIKSHAFKGFSTFHLRAEAVSFASAIEL